MGFLVRLTAGKTQPKKSIIGEFITALDSGEVKEFSMQPDQGVYEVRGKMKDYKEDEEFVTNIPPEMTSLQSKITDIAATTRRKNLKST